MTQQIIRSLAFLLLVAVAADAANCPNLTYTDASNVTALTGSFSCGMGWYGAHGKGTTAFVADEGNCYYYSVYWPDSVCLYEKALTYFGIDPVMCRDSMRRYVEFHPFATVSPGQTLNAFRYSNSSTGDMWYRQTGNSAEPWVNQYNWLVGVQPINMEASYQQYVILGLAGCLDHFDWNEEANMLYNYMLLFPDSASDASCWYTIRGIRATQSRVPQDTTPFHKLTFPLKPLPDAGVHQRATGGRTAMDVSVLSDAGSQNLTVTYGLLFDGDADVTVLNQLGKSLAHTRTEYLPKGRQQVALPISGIPSGAYYLRIQTAQAVATKPFLIVR